MVLAGISAPPWSRLIIEAGEFAVRQFGDVHGQTEFYAGLFDIQGPLPMPRQIVRAVWE
jgi:hypothetical protein